MAFAVPIMAMIYSIGDVSGCHINPAVTLGLCLARRLPSREVFPYMASQVLGAFLASGLLRVLFVDYPGQLGTTQPAGSEMQAFILETIATAILMFVILSVTSGSKEKGILAGLAISGVIFFDIVFIGLITGSSINPARSLAPAVVSGTLAHLWIYLTAPFLGACVGVICWRVTHGHLCAAEGKEKDVN